MQSNILNSSLTLALLANSTCVSIAAMFSNSDRITINDFSNATPYPSSIEVTGLSGGVTNLTVTIQGFSHTWVSDADILLAEPSGKSVLLMTHVGGSFSVTNLTLTFDDSAAASLPTQGPLLSGTYKPTQLRPITDFTSPAPSGPYGSALSAFSDLDPNTVWSLYVRDDSLGNRGVITGGWSLAIFTASKPEFVNQPLSQTAEIGSTVGLWGDASSPLPLFYLWCLDDTNLMSWSTNCDLELTNVQLSQSGAYTLVVSNTLGAVTSAPAMLNVIAGVERRPVPGVQVTGEAGSLLNVDYASFLTHAPDWTTLGSVSLTSTSQYYFDLTLPLPPKRYYRTWQSGTPSVMPSLDLHLVSAITLTGNIGDSVRLDYINQFGPTDTWVTLDTLPLTNNSQLYFDVSAWRQPQRLYRLVPLP